MPHARRQLGEEVLFLTLERRFDRVHEQEGHRNADERRSAKTLSVSGTATSDGFTATLIGNYCFRAEYTPDQFAAYAAGSHTNTTTECFSVISPATTTVTTPSNGGTIGS